MRRRSLALTFAAGAALVLSSLLAVPAAAAGAGAGATVGEARVCARAAAGQVACDAHVRTSNSRPDATSTWGGNGFSPAQLKTAYGLGTLDTTTPIAVVDAYANPNAAVDLAAYRTQFGLGTANLTQYGQDGTSRLPAGNTGWGQEQMLDLEMVSAMCKSCPIIYVGASSTSFSDLGTAVNTAVAKGAKVVSNSYGGNESSSETSIQSLYYTHAGVAITVSSGDSGYGPESPAAFSTVTAVGGTHLVLNANGTRSSESVWSGAGSGCSSYIAKPSWQHDTGCSRRTIADVSAVADPATGVAVYDSYGSTGGNNWYVFGGTSVSAPIIGGVYALSGNTSGTPASLAYASAGTMFDVTSGANTRHCRAGYLCSATVGYDGPSGLGTPNGNLTAF